MAVSEDGLRLVGQLAGLVPSIARAQPSQGLSCPPSPAGRLLIQVQIDDPNRTPRRSEEVMSSSEEPEELVDGPRMGTVNVGELPLGVVVIGDVVEDPRLPEGGNDPLPRRSPLVGVEDCGE